MAHITKPDGQDEQTHTNDEVPLHQTLPLGGTPLLHAGYKYPRSIASRQPQPQPRLLVLCEGHLTRLQAGGEREK